MPQIKKSKFFLAQFAFLPIFALRKREKSKSRCGVLKIAKVAQLVEHDLAKVGVASSNLVFRSNPFHKKGFIVK